MKMYEIEVSEHDEGVISLCQPGERENDVILISYDQAALLCEWIMAIVKGSEE